LKILNISNNSLTNEAVYELKEALIVNKQITSLFLVKTKLSDEGVIALAEYIAETGSLSRLDLRDNDIRLGGLMALVSSLKFNNTLSRLDVDREPRKEHNVKIFLLFVFYLFLFFKIIKDSSLIYKKRVHGKKV